MLFPKRFWAGMADGSITAAYRRWKRPMVVAGRTHRSPVGILEITSVAEVEPASVLNEDAHAAGFRSAADLLSEFPARDGELLYHIKFRLAAGPDPRAELAADADLSPDQFSELRKRLARLDSASPAGPWTHRTLRLVRDNPAVRAGDLAPQMRMDLQPFKLNVRKLKNLGLTISLGTGYRLSPRGEAFLQMDGRSKS